MSAGPLELFLIVLVILLLFGAGRVPGIMENIAKGVKSFKQGLKDDDASPKIEKKDNKN
ncbi:MAG TPA: twin-arginine translocase TatA/TatE family subunit [Alphaproteobacteria bacterium]|jgi:sec-independent protein translocase protein TatA|nr:twin-arginine translocase TatA/TatE family subunit [Micavibrio sp.]MBK9562873.1 twin-arginine translocase TatA/TatE family subunit [Micavibrio sp.]MBP7722441.1 twin-arginine translocase TatA/TatE family subunit [Alphaproteobacteria bacterium]MCE7886922.1 twin-arginine translocase TatA/TatE family subunit [Alphaproteobacteria bacterium PRO2]HQX26876.1 twin-arginine translocase TatA/TatE family subunit [Alphaproteobacteria bacterium]